jgi:hypothetical protein
MQETALLEIGHDVANGRRAHRQPRLLVQGARTHGLAVADVTRHQQRSSVLARSESSLDHATR